LCCISASAQALITGKIVDEETDAPMANANIYINGSTIGTTSAQDGSFTLQTTKSGFVDIIASFVGYETIMYQTRLESAPLRVVFRLRPRAPVMHNVLIMSREQRERWLAVLRENFLGVTPAAERCTIQNEDEIQFEAGDKTSILKAYSEAPLVVINKELGYRIYFQLAEFYLNKDDNRTYFLGYSRFEELSNKQPVPKRYLSARKDYYTGSTMHFYHSLISHRSKEEGFSLRILRKMQPDRGAGLQTHQREPFQ
jgi:hypothetical protein